MKEPLNSKPTEECRPRPGKSTPLPPACAKSLERPARVDSRAQDNIGLIVWGSIWVYEWLSKLWPLFGYPKYQVPYYNRDLKRDHNFDNHPYRDHGLSVEQLKTQYNQSYSYIRDYRISTQDTTRLSSPHKPNSFHFIFHSPYITPDINPIYYSSFHVLFH